MADNNNKLDLILDKIKELNKDGFNIVKPDRSKYIKDRIEKLVKLYDYDEDTKAKILVKYNETKETGVTLIDAIYSKEFKEKEDQYINANIDGKLNDIEISLDTFEAFDDPDPESDTELDIKRSVNKGYSDASSKGLARKGSVYKGFGSDNEV